MAFSGMNDKDDAGKSRHDRSMPLKSQSADDADERRWMTVLSAFICVICGWPFREYERHRPLRHRRDCQRWIHSRIRGCRRAVDHIEAVVAEDAVAVVDHTILRGRTHAGAAEDVRGGGRAEDGLAEEAAGKAVDLLLHPPRQLRRLGDGRARR